MSIVLAGEIRLGVVNIALCSFLIALYNIYVLINNQ